MTPDKWIWMPHAGHYICGNKCKFHLATWVGNFIVSTVGEYLPALAVRGREVCYENVGCDRKYETMVFRSMKADEDCCPYRMAAANNLDFAGYNDPGEARLGHLKLCRKWANKRKGSK